MARARTTPALGQASGELRGALQAGGLARYAAWLLAGLASAGLVLLTGHLAGSLTASVRWAFAIAFLAVSGQILLVSRATPQLRGAWLWGSLLFAFGVLSLVSGARLTAESAALATAALLWTATGLGAALGFRIDKPGHVLAVAAVSAVSDLWSVYDPAGPSATLARNVALHPDRVPAFALCFPLLGSDKVPAIIGAGDILFCALYLAAFERHKLPLGRALLALTAAFVVGLGLLLWLERPLPLLPLLGGAVVLCDRRARSLEAKEGRTVLAVVALAGALLALRLWI